MKTSEEARALLSARAVREASRRMLALGLDGALPEWRVDLDALPKTADFVAGVIRDRYPTLEVPFHARWRHFVVNGRDLWAELTDGSGRVEEARAAFDLAIVSVLLDAGAGPGWRYYDAATDTVVRRSEGLAVASLRLFASGALKADALTELSGETLAQAFQVSDDNPLVGLESRAALLRRLGRAVGRPGSLFDVMAARAEDGRLPAPVILEVLLEALGPIWQGRLTLGGVPLGDCWEHPQAGLVPLHKLSQWLAYSLIEPLQDVGIEVVDIDGLTGLAEYRNGGLFVDCGVLALKDGADRVYEVGSPLVVGWRSLTVALLDEIAPLVRERLGVSAQDFPLARVLEGGTWAAGRIIAAQKRDDGGPPLKIASDGTVF